MMSPRSTYITAAGHEIHVSEWGDPAHPTLVMWHGMARNGRDFDEAAAALCDRYFVVCPDTLGRGLSAWARDVADYSFATYQRIAMDILEHYGIGRLRFVGTSMGGLIGITLAGGELKDRITHLVVNDIGPNVPGSAVGRITSFVGTPPVFATIAELEAWYRKNYAQFGNNTDKFWRRMADSSYRRMDDGRVTVHYDPRIVNQLSNRQPDLSLWDCYDAVSAKTLLFRGAESDVLPENVAAEMVRRGPRPRLEVRAGCGHAPALTSEAEIALMRDFLAS